jgi:O-antigen ligase
MGQGSNPASAAALIVLVVLAVVMPWPFGGAHPLVAQSVAIATLLASLAVVACSRAPIERPPRLLPPLFGLWCLAACQLLLLPGVLHRLLARGSAAVWHPRDPVAAAVLGAGRHPISVDPEATARWLALTTGLVALAVLAAPALRERRAALRASVAVVAGAVAVALYGFVARLAFGDKLFGLLAVPTIAPFGPFVSKNHFAGYVEMAACLSVGLAAGLADEARRGPERLSWLESARVARIVFAWGAAIVLILGVPVSLSRGGVVGLAAGLAAFAAVRVGTHRPGRRRGRALALAVGALILVVAGIAFVLPQRATARMRTLAGVSSDSSGSYRLATWRDSVRLVASSPFVGSGFGAFEDALPRFKTAAGNLRVQHAENDYLELLAEGGLAGGLLAGCLVLTAVFVASRRIRDEPHRLSRGLRAGALAGLTALLVHSAFDFNLRILSNASLFGLLAAFALAPVDRVAADAAPPRAGHHPGECILGVAALAVALVLAVATPWKERNLESTTFQRAAQGNATDLRWLSLERHTVAHLRRRPADATAWVGLAWLRRPASPAEADALTNWGVGLDPQHQALVRAAKRMAGAPGTEQRRH